MASGLRAEETLQKMCEPVRECGKRGATTTAGLLSSCAMYFQRRAPVPRNDSWKFGGRNSLRQRLRFRELRRKLQRHIPEGCFRNHPGAARDLRKTDGDSR